MSDKTHFIETDEVQDVAGSIRHVIRCWEIAKNDPHAWKWVMLALHGALQGASICHLLTTARPIGAVTKKNRQEWLEYFENSHTDNTLKRPKTHLMALPDLLKAVRKPNSAGGNFDADHQVTISDSELEWLKRMHRQFRNQFVHFSPTNWSIDVSGMPKFTHLNARIITDILDCGWAFRHLDEEKRNLLRNDLQLLGCVEI